MFENIEDQIRQINELAVLAFELYRRGEYTQAIIFAKQVLDRTRHLVGNEHPAVATSLNNLATFYKEQGYYDKAEPLYMQALNLRQHLLGNEHPDVALTLNNLGALYYEQGRYSKAEPLLKQSLNLARRLLGDKHPDVVLTLNNLATLYWAQGRYTEAELLYKQVLELWQYQQGDKHPDIVLCLNNLALLYKKQGRYTEAELLSKQALDLVQHLWGNEHPYVALCLNNLALLYNKQGRYTEAESLLKQALYLDRHRLGDEHRNVANSLNNLAGLYHDQGRYSEAEPLYEQSLHLRRHLLGDEHHDVAESLNNLAGLYHDQGRYSEAEPLYKQALHLRRHLLGDEHHDVAESLNNLAVFYCNQGRYGEAEPLYEQALHLRRHLLGDEHCDVAQSLNNLAGLYHNQGRFSEAEFLYGQALHLWRHLLGDEHPNVALGLNNLASLYQYQGRYSEAEPLLKQALHKRQQQWGDKHPDVALSLNNLALLYQEQGRYREAKPLYEQALELGRRLLGNQHPFVALSLENLAILLAATNRPTEALAHRLQATQIEDRLISQVFATSSEHDRLAYLQTIRANFDIFLSLVLEYLSHSAKAVQAALDLIVRRKALTAAALAAQNQALYSGRYPHLIDQFQQLRSLSDRIIHLTFSPPSLDQLTIYQQHLAQLQAEYNDLQRQLASQVPEIQLQEQSIDCRAVALELPEGTTLVEFVCFHVFDFNAILARGEAQWQPVRYLAFVLPAKQPDQVQMIDLGEVEPIDRLIQIFRQSLSLDGNNLGNRLDMGGDDDDSEFLQYNPAAGIELRQVLFDPIRPYLSESKHLLLSLDGGLNLVPFQILPTDETGQQLLMDEYTISYLSTGRDILRSKIQTTRPAVAPLVIADPDFNLKGEESAEATTTNPTQLLNTLAGVHFERAPGTRFLGEGVAKMLQVSPYLGKEALESHLTTGECPNILLIATHGVFLPDSPHSPPQPPLSRGEQDWFSFNRLSGIKVENPMLRSGLALAGANTWLSGDSLPKEAGKGFLFAQDVAALDLWATELTVLSACNTAIGDIKIGEGVFGLRRAFAVAGAKTLVMSLWSVPDRATALLIERFFTNLRQGLGRADALQDAQNYIRTITVKELQQSPLGLSVLEELKEPLPQEYHFCQDDRPLEHPYFWGAWVCQGDTTPMGRANSFSREKIGNPMFCDRC
jgi:tetratricopeptide (TPR) repeat protein/CHAT domain-containing protein